MDEGFGRSFILVRRRTGGNPRYLGPSCSDRIIAQAHTAREQGYLVTNIFPFSNKKQYFPSGLFIPLM